MSEPSFRFPGMDRDPPARKGRVMVVVSLLLIVFSVLIVLGGLTFLQAVEPPLRAVKKTIPDEQLGR